MSSPTLFDLIRQAEQLLDAIASHPDYVRLQEGNHLTNLDFTLADTESFLMQLNQAFGEISEPEAGNNYPSFEEVFGEASLSNSLTLLEPTVTPINSIEERF
jgi:hypothetical protein